MTTEPIHITILIVDDGAVDRFLAGGLVEKSLGWNVLYADNGLAALTLVEREQPRMVLTDLQMPAMDGLELVEALGMQQSSTEARYIIADEGPGLNPSLMEDPTNPTNLEKGSGRGLMLIRTFMDEVVFNDKGNQVTLVKRRDRGKEAVQ